MGWSEAITDAQGQHVDVVQAGAVRSLEALPVGAHGKIVINVIFQADTAHESRLFAAKVRQAAVDAGSDIGNSAAGGQRQLIHQRKARGKPQGINVQLFRGRGQVHRIGELAGPAITGFDRQRWHDLVADIELEHGRVKRIFGTAVPR